MNNELDALLQNAYQHHLAGRYSAAIQDYQDAIRLDPEYAYSHYNLHLVYRNTNALPLALKELEEAARLSPDDGDIYLSMALLYGEMGNRKKAQELQNIASQLPGDSANRQITLGLLAGQQKDYQQSLIHFEEAQRQQPDFPEIYGYIGLALLRLGRDVEAQQALLDATREETASPKTFYNLAAAEKRLHNYAAATQALERAVQINENYHKAWLLLVSTEAHLGHWRSAWRYFQKGVKSHPIMRT